jgi:hypothetical protein
MGGAIVALVGMISRLNKKQTGPIHERAERSANRWSVPSLGWRQPGEFRDASHADDIQIERRRSTSASQFDLM